MKGFTHFVTGLTAASFFPWTVQAAQEGRPLYFLLGGICGLLPDTLDFKFYRFFYRHDVVLDPPAPAPDPLDVARRVADAIDRARREGRTVRLKLGTIRMGADLWRQYQVRLDAARGEVEVAVGPVVTTGQVPVPGHDPACRTARCPLPCPVVQTYDSVTKIDIFDGPTFGFEPCPDGRVRVHFLPWHREWTHSVTLGLLLSAIGWGIWGWRAAVVMMAGLLAHVLEDQLGYMGSNLFFPLTRRRAPGFHLMRSGDAWPNFGVIWICVWLIFWNLYRAIPSPLYTLRLFPYLLVTVAAPLGLLALALRWARGRSAPAADRLDTDADWDAPGG